MSFLSNIYDNFEHFSGVIDNEDLLEGRFENNVDGNPIYIGYNLTANASTADPTWYIIFILYDGQNIIRKRLPDNGIGFFYSWDLRATYFS